MPEAGNTAAAQRPPLPARPSPETEQTPKRQPGPLRALVRNATDIGGHSVPFSATHSTQLNATRHTQLNATRTRRNATGTHSLAGDSAGSRRTLVSSGRGRLPDETSSPAAAIHATIESSPEISTSDRFRERGEDNFQVCPNFAVFCCFGDELNGVDPKSTRRPRGRTARIVYSLRAVLATPKTHYASR